MLPSQTSRSLSPAKVIQLGSGNFKIKCLVCFRLTMDFNTKFNTIAEVEGQDVFH